MDGLSSSGSWLTLRAKGEGLIALVWRSAASNPVADGEAAVRLGRASAEAEPAARAAGAAVDAASPLWACGAPLGPRLAYACATPLEVSVVNLQPVPILVYAELVSAGGAAGGAAGGSATALRTGLGLARLVPRYEGRGRNCLLLAAHEGLPICAAEDGERGPFGESNTFR